MAKVKNQRIWSTDREFLTRLAEDFEFIGRPHRLDLKNGCLTVFALPQRKPKKKKQDEKSPRNKRAESAGRHLTGS
jgi:hypothetical protein